jgi:hypothetical protein
MNGQPQQPTGYGGIDYSAFSDPPTMSSGQPQQEVHSEQYNYSYDYNPGTAQMQNQQKMQMNGYGR